MKYLKSVLINVPDQVLSTFLLWGCLFMWYRAIVSIWNDPPSANTVLVVILIGVVLGLIVSRTQMEKPHEKDSKIPTVGE